MKLTIIRNISLVALFAFITLIYFNCSDNNPTGTNNSSSNVISGKVTGWSLGTKTISAKLNSRSGSQYEICSCPIDANGNFSLTLPDAVADTALFHADTLFTFRCAGNVQINPADSRAAYIYDLDVMDSTQVRGYIEFNNYDTIAAGACVETYYYVNKNFTVNGTQYCNSLDSVIYNCTFNKGWNKIYAHVLKFSGNQLTAAYNNTICSGAVWKYKPYPDKTILR